MKIFIDARLYGLENAGLGRYAINLLKGLSEADLANQYFVLLRKKYFDTLKFPGNFTKVLGEFGHYSLAEQYLLPGLISKYKPDLAHFLHFNVPLFCPCPYVVTIHDLLMQRYRGVEATTLSPLMYFLKQIASKIVFNSAVHSSARIIVPSTAVAMELGDYYGLSGRKVEVIHEGVEKIKPRKDQGAVLDKFGLTKYEYLIYTGNAYPHKNLERAIKAVKLYNLNTKNPICFGIASSRTVFVKRLMKMIKENDADDYVKLLGFVSDGELGVLYTNSLAFIYPSLSEGFGLPGLEAMSCQTVALVSDIPVFKEIYGDSVMYFDPNKMESIADTIGKVRSMKPEQRLKFVRKGLAYIKRYDWHVTTDETLRVYKSLAT